MATNPLASAHDQLPPTPPPIKKEWCGRNVCKMEYFAWTLGALLILAGVALLSLQAVYNYNFFAAGITSASIGGFGTLLGLITHCCHNDNCCDKPSKSSKEIVATAAPTIIPTVIKKEEAAAPIEVSAKEFFEAKGIFGLPQELLDELSIWHEYRLNGPLDLTFDAGFLLHGPPGTGKTTIAKAIADFLGGDYKEIRSGDLKSKWYGETEKNITALFKVDEDKFRVVTIDEITGIFPKRGDSHHVANEVVDHMLGIIDGTPSETPRYLIIGTTNQFDKLDEALLRDGRLGKHFLIDLPNLETRQQIFASNLKKANLDSSIDADAFARELAEKNEGSCAALIGKIGAAKRKAFLDGRRPLKKEDFGEDYFSEDLT